MIQVKFISGLGVFVLGLSSPVVAQEQEPPNKALLATVATEGRKLNAAQQEWAAELAQLLQHYSLPTR